jgi:8-amino-7-oxononanoate synthase
MTRADAIAQDELAQLQAQGLRRALQPVEGLPGPRVQQDGRALLNLCANDYLGLGADRRLMEAAARGALQGAGSGASRLVVGTLPVHVALEQELARLAGSEAALLFNSGYCANTGVVPALCGPGDAVFSDALNHASLIDGARLSRAEVVVYPHLDVARLQELLERSRARRKLIVTDSVFSMDGDLAPLQALTALAEAHGAMLLVDEAHAVGIYGSRGAGLCEALGLQERIDLRLGTLSKAAGSFGAFVAASHAVCELLLNRARPFIFSTALPPAVCATSRAALPLLAESPRREALWRNIRFFAAGLNALGLPAEPRSPIFPVVLGAPQRAVAVAEALWAGGVLVKAIRPPTVAEGTSRLRFSLSALHTEDELAGALELLGRALGPRRLTA